MSPRRFEDVLPERDLQIERCRDFRRLAMPDVVDGGIERIAEARGQHRLRHPARHGFLQEISIGFGRLNPALHGAPRLEAER